MKNPEYVGGGVGVTPLGRTPGSDYHDRLVTGFGMMFASEDSPGVKNMTLSGDRLNRIDDTTDNWENPLLDWVVREIVREVAEMRLLGTLMPFREGQHVGMLPRRVPVKKLTKAQFAKLHNERMTREREAMLQLRAKNDHEIALLTGRRF